MANKLERLQDELHQIEKQFRRERRKLLKLPAKLGFASVEELIGALQLAVGGRVKAEKGDGRRQRALITPEIKAHVKSLIETGKTGQAVAAAVGISLPSVAKVKRELGLSKRRRRKK